MYRRRKIIHSVVGLAATGILLAGCSGAGTSSATGGAAALDPKHPITINVVRSAGGQFEPLMLGIQKGYFAAAGLDVHVTAGTGNPATLAPQLVSGQIQFAMIDSASPIAAVSQHIPISLISVIQNDAPTLPESAGVLVAPGSPIKTVTGLKGKTIATGQIAGLPVISTNLALKAAGISPHSVKWVQLTPDALQAAATNGQADAILTYAAFFTGAQQNGFTFLKDTATGTTLPRVTQVAWGASNQYIAQNPAVVAAFVKANERAEQYANSHPEAVRQIDKKMTQLPAAYIEVRTIQPFGGPFHVHVMQQLADAMQEQGFITTKVDVAKGLIWSEAAKG